MPLQFVDDFPQCAGFGLDTKQYYEAFLRAKKVLSAAPKAARESDPQRRLNELTSHFYRGGNEAGALYRKRDDASLVLVAIWLSRVRELAGWYVAANRIPACEGLSSEVISRLPRQFANPHSLPEISPLLSQLGIALVYEAAIPGIKLDGVVFRFQTGQVVIGMSLRYSRLDNFWFTLLHELSHVVLHLNELDVPIIDDLDEESDTIVEMQADRLAGDSLIPRNEWRSCPARYTNSISDVNAFATSLGIPPQVVAGRLRREAKRYDIFSELINQFDAREILGVNKI